MIQRFSIFALLLCALALARPVSAKESAAQAADRRAIVAAYTNSNAAMMRKDISRAASFLAPDFVYHSPKGSADRENYLRGLGLLTAMPQVRYTLARTENMRIEWRGPDAVVYSDQITQLNGPGGVAYARTKFRDYWGKTSAGWQVRQAVELSGTISINGRVYRR